MIDKTWMRVSARVVAGGGLVCLLLSVTAAVSGTAWASEVCRFSGTTDHAGHVAVTSDVAASDGVTTVDVTVAFDAMTMFWVQMNYLVEELSRWRGEKLESVAVNTRYLVGGRIVRQQWDEFQRRSNGLRAYRVQAKTLDDFRLKHPGFVQHWDPGTFGQPWLPDYPRAVPERRADLDLMRVPLPEGLQTPLALAFYWIRWLPSGGEDVPVFLPGFKADKMVDLSVTGALVADGMMWRAPLRYPALSETPGSMATAFTSSDHHLRQLAFELHGPNGSARGTIDQAGCKGAAVVPALK